MCRMVNKERTSMACFKVSLKPDRLLGFNMKGSGCWLHGCFESLPMILQPELLNSEAVLTLVCRVIPRSIVVHCSMSYVGGFPFAFCWIAEKSLRGL